MLPDHHRLTALLVFLLLLVLGAWFFLWLDIYNWYAPLYFMPVVLVLWLLPEDF